MKRFTVTHEHLALLRAARVSWCSRCAGAPRVDCKKPYGNGDVFSDMGRILGWEPVGEDEDGFPDYTDVQREHLGALHRQTETALQIVLATGEFRAGAYEASPCDRDWRPANGGGGKDLRRRD